MSELKKITHGVFLCVTVTFLSACMHYGMRPSQELKILPPGLYELSLRDHEALLQYPDFNTLLLRHQAQVYRSFCGMASTSISLSVLKKKSVKQSNLFPNKQQKKHAMYNGITLQDLKRLNKYHGLEARIIYADNLKDADEMVRLIEKHLLDEKNILLVNYSRKILQQDGGGHISPVGGYDKKSKRVLIMDVSPHYPHTWVPAQQLFDAVNTKDNSVDRYRGFLELY